MADTVTPPEFLEYSPADIVSMGVEQGLPPDRIARGLMKHRANIEGWGREQNADAPDKYFKGAIQLDKDIETQLGQVRLSAERAALSQALPDPAAQRKLISQLEAGGYDPDAVDADLKPALDNVLKVRGSDAFQMPARSYGGAVKVGDTTLARYAMREAGDGMMDVSLAFDDDSTDLVRIPKVTPEDVTNEQAQRDLKIQTLQQRLGFQSGQTSAPVPGDPASARESAQGAQESERLLQQAQAAADELKRGGASYLQAERVRDALKDERFRGKAGQYGGWSEFLKGVNDAIINSGALLARVAGRDDWLTELGQGQEALDTAFPGSTRRKLEGGLFNDAVTGAQRAVGMMAPMIAGGAATRGLTYAVGAEAELARQAAGRLGVAGAGMSAAASGGAYLDTQREINAAEAAGDQARADRIRFGRDAHALLTGVAEGAVERLGAAQAFNVGRGAKALGKDFLAEGIEEPVTGILQRGIIDPITIDRNEDVLGPVALEALTGLMAAGPLVGGGAAINRLTGNGNASRAPNTQPPPPTPGTPPTAITPLVNIARQAGAQDRVRLTPEEAAAGLADPGTIEGDLLTDARFRPPGAVAPTLQPLPNVADQSGLTDLGTVEGDVLERVPQRESQAGVEPLNTQEIPLGMMRPYIADQTMERLSDSEFETRANAGIRLVDELERQFDDQPDLIENQEFRQRLANAQDEFKAIELEKLRRQATRQFSGDVFADALQVAAQVGPPSQSNLQSLSGSRLAMMIKVLRQSQFSDSDAREGLSYSAALMQDPDYREMAGVRARRLKEWADFLDQQEQGLAESVIAQESQARGIRPPTPGTVSRQGSALPFEEIVGMAAAAIRNGLTNFSAWATAMVRRFGESVRRFLAEAWQAATAAANRASKAPLQFGQRPLERRARAEEAGFLHPGDLPKAITTRLGLQQNAPFRVKPLGARDLFLGSTLPRNMVPLVARSENEVKAVEQTAAQLARDLQAAETAAVNRRGLPLDRLHGHVTDFLNGVPVAGAILSAMDPVTYDRARRMRNFIDDLTAEIAASLPAGTMRDTLVNNTGSWLRRSYAAFDPNSGWNFENVMTAARKGKDVGGRPALDILRKGAAYLSAQNGYPASMRTSQGLPVAGSELESDMRNLMDRDQYERALSGQPSASKNVTSLMRRKDIPPEIRELMGEETNVYKRFTASASFQAQFIRRHHAQVAMRQVGLASGLFSMNRGGVFTQQIPADGPRWSGLEGVWTTPELWEALQLSTGVAAAGTDIAGYVGRFLRYTSSKAKLSRVALNPDSWMVNGLGGAAMMLMNGDWFSGRVAARLMESVRLMRAGRAKSGDVVNAAQDTLKDIQRDLIARLTAEGVFGAGVSVADIEASLPRHTLQWIETDLMRDRAAGTVEGAIIGQGMGRGFGTEVRVVGGIIGGALGGIAGAKRIRTAQNAIADLALTKPDMLFRLTGFLTNYEAALGAGLAPDAAFNEASTRTLNTFPNYAAVPAFLRSLSQFGAINSFVSFMFEMHRNTAWSMRYMAEDLAAPSMAQKRRGLQRLAGAGAVGALMAGGLPALISLLLGGGDDKDKVGMDDERNNIFTRWFAAPWERDAILAFTKFDKEGVSYLNTSYLLPQQILGELAMAARNGDNPTDAAARIAVRLQTQFAGDSVNLTPLMQAYTNTDGRGRPVTVRSGIEGAWERTDHALKVIAEPGFVEKVNRLAYAYYGTERRGRTFSVEQEFRRVIGLRETTRTWSDLTLGRYKEFDSQIGRIREGANRTLGENLPGAKATALERANRELAEIRTELQRFEKEAVKLGVPFGILQRAKKDVGLSNIRNVMVDPIKRNRVKSIGTR
jgi:hypothetical protein